MMQIATIIVAAWQWAITMFVVETFASPAYPLGMLTHDEILDELISQLDAGKLRPKQVADVLGLPSSRVAEMRKRTRRIQQRQTLANAH